MLRLFRKHVWSESDGVSRLVWTLIGIGWLGVMAWFFVWFGWFDPTWAIFR